MKKRISSKRRKDMQRSNPFWSPQLFEDEVGNKYFTKRIRKERK